MPDEADQQKAITGLLFIATGVAVIVLVIDLRIKNDILASAQKVRADIDRFERKYFSGAKADSGSSGVSHNIDASSSWGNYMDGASRVEAASPLSQVAHGFGATEGKNLHSVPGAGSDSVEVQEGDGDV